MSTIEPRVQATLDAAMNLVRSIAASAAVNTAQHLDTLVQNATRPAEREQYFLVLQELRRNAGVFEATFHEALRERVAKDVAPRPDAKRKLESADWATLSLVEDKEVEERMNYVRLGQLISHECEWQLRELAAYMGSLLGLGRADDDRNPLRAEVIGAALYRGIESVSGDRDNRRILARELGQAVAQGMPQGYADILQMLKQRGVQPVTLTVRTVEGPGNQMHGVNSAYASLPGREGRNSTRGSGYGELDSGASDLDLLAAHRRALATAFPDGARVDLPGDGPRDLARDSQRDSGRSSSPGRMGRQAPATRALADAAADQQLMTLLRRLTALPSRAGDLDPRAYGYAAAAPGAAGAPAYPSLSAGLSAHGLMPGAMPGAMPGPVPGGYAGGSEAGTGGLDSSRGGIGTAGGSGSGLNSGPNSGPNSGAGQAYGDGLTGLMAVNMIRAHREELIQASSGKLDHMVIDVVGSLFDQILSDSRVPPQMAREIARLQLPVLRVALNDSTFFSTRRHPVRRFINRIASLANAFDDFAEGPGAEFLARVRKLVDDIVDGDFDQIELYAAKVTELERFIANQTEGEVEKVGAVSTLEAKESELRVQQRYMLQLRSALQPLGLPGYLHDFLAEVWSQALALAVRRDGPDSDRAKRYRRVGTDLVMSVQPKGSPVLRKKFLMQLPPLMKDLNDGMRLIGWAEQAQKAFFAQLLPAHAESLKSSPLTELDYNLRAKQLEAIFAQPVPGAEFAMRGEAAPVDSAVIEKRFSAEEAERIGLVPEAAVDWSEPVAPSPVDIDLDLSLEQPPAPVQARPGETLVADPTSSPAEMREVVDSTLGPTTSESGGDVGEPVKGPQLIDHIKLGFAYQMHLKDEWQKVRLAHVSSGRTFFVFTRGGKHQETISMTARMLARMCETGRMRALESRDLMERATVRARKQLAELAVPTRH